MWLQRLLLFIFLPVAQVMAECHERDIAESGTRYWNCGDAEVKIRNRGGSFEILLRLQGAFGMQEYLGERVENGQAIEIQGRERFSGGLREILIVRGMRSEQKCSWEIEHSDYAGGSHIRHLLTLDGSEVEEAFFEGERHHNSPLSSERFSVVGAVTRDDPEAVYCQIGLCSQ